MTSTTVDTTRPQRKRTTKGHLKKKELWTAGMRHNCGKMLVRQSWTRQVVCVLHKKTTNIAIYSEQ